MRHLNIQHPYKSKFEICTINIDKHKKICYNMSVEEKTSAVRPTTTHVYSLPSDNLRHPQKTNKNAHSGREKTYYAFLFLKSIKGRDMHAKNKNQH